MVEFPTRGGVPQCTLEHYERDFADRHLVHGVVARWAAERPLAPAVIDAETGDEVSWERLDMTSDAMAMRLLQEGYRPGDTLATTLPLLVEHVLMEIACFKIGVRFAPLDPRLEVGEVVRLLSVLRPRGYVFPGRGATSDRAGVGRAVRDRCPFVEHLVQRSPPDRVMEGAVSMQTLAEDAMQIGLQVMTDPGSTDLPRRLAEVSASVGEDDGALVLVTSGPAGQPAPALLSHRNITVQNMCLGAALGIHGDSRMLVSLPPSHVGCQTEQLMTPWFYGGAAVILRAEDAEASLEAIRRHRVSCLGRSPALLDLPSPPARDEVAAPSLRFAFCGGRRVSRASLERLASLAPGVGSGLELTEAAGFCTYTPRDGCVDDIAAGAGRDMPVYPLSIRAPMAGDGSAGAELPRGEEGHVCFTGPQTFLGYVGDPEATAAAISRDGVLYTGEQGVVDDAGLHLADRRRDMSSR